MSKLPGKVAFISGIARGQGRAHAIRLAREGADIIGFDICEQMATVPYAMSTRTDLEETIKLVEGENRRIIAEQADVRDGDAVAAVLARGVELIGSVDIVVANAGIMPVVGEVGDSRQAWQDTLDVMLTGVYNTVEAARPYLVRQGRGGSVVIISSTAGLKGSTSGSAGSLGYVAAKHGVVGLMRGYARTLSPHSVRVNSVHPTGVNTPMIVNEAFGQFIAENPELAESMQNLLPVPMIEASDVASAVAWLASDEARYVTGVTLPVDAGFTVR
jgi:SDR family mycofactocin-dependent oxidoreductase